MEVYKLELTEDEILVIEKALNLFHSIGRGRFRAILSNYSWKNVSDIVSDLLELATKQLTGLPKSVSWGINDSNVSQDCRIAEMIETNIKKILK